MKYAVINNKGIIIQTGHVTTEEEMKLQGGSRLSLFCPEYINDADYYYKNGKFHKYPPKPSSFSEWDGERWVDSVEKKKKQLLRIRSIRDSLLNECDWTQMPDVDLTDQEKLAWKQYRQKLRDITDTNDLENVEWPVKPNK